MVKTEEINRVLNKDLQEIAQRYSEKELKAIAAGGRLVPGLAKVPVVDFSGQHIRFGAFGDTHIGSIYFDEGMYFQAIKEFKKEKCDFIVHTGDVVDGLTHRPDHIFHLTHISYEDQKDYAIKLLKEIPAPFYVISGNHDRFWIKRGGSDIVKNIVKEVPNGTYLGHDEGDISLKGAVLKLWHGEDGNSYAKSYRIQKVAEAFTGGEKPNILCLGHTHKSLYMQERNIQCISLGCIERQSDWMRSKRIKAETGFWIVDAWIKNGGVSKFTTTWYPFYA